MADVGVDQGIGEDEGSHPRNLVVRAEREELRQPIGVVDREIEPDVAAIASADDRRPRYAEVVHDAITSPAIR